MGACGCMSYREVQGGHVYVGQPGVSRVQVSLMAFWPDYWKLFAKICMIVAQWCERRCLLFQKYKLRWERTLLPNKTGTLSIKMLFPKPWCTMLTSLCKPCICWYRTAVRRHKIREREEGWGVANDKGVIPEFWCFWTLNSLRWRCYLFTWLVQAHESKTEEDIQTSQKPDWWEFLRCEAVIMLIFIVYHLWNKHNKKYLLCSSPSLQLLPPQPRPPFSHIINFPCILAGIQYESSTFSSLPPTLAHL